MQSIQQLSWATESDNPLSFLYLIFGHLGLVPPGSFTTKETADGLIYRYPT